MPDDLFHRHRVLRDHDQVRAARETTQGGNPAGGATHRLDDDDAVVGDGGGMETVERLGDNIYSGVETYAEIGPGQVVVKRFGYSDHRCAAFGEPVGDALRAVAADGHQGVEVLVDGFEHARLDRLRADRG